MNQSSGSGCTGYDTTVKYDGRTNEQQLKSDAIDKQEVMKQKNDELI